jgi:predicted nucleotidyltransferase
MKHTSSISYDALQAPGLKDILEQVSIACKELGIEFFMVGAVARNTWLVAHNERPKGTKDIDFAVYIPDIGTYNRLRERLLEGCGYRPSGDNAFCLLSPGGAQIDLLPFGEIEQQGQVLVQGKGLVSIKLDGFREVYALGLTQVSLGEEQFAVCNIPSIIILKLIAFDDRPERRVKDVKDIAGILKYYPSLEQDHIWENYFDLYEQERSHEDVAMIGLGREMNAIARGNEKLQERLVSILQKGIAGRSSLADHMVMDSEKENIAQKRAILGNILLGLTMEA